MITHPGARTRALYMWEANDLIKRDSFPGLKFYNNYIVYAFPRNFLMKVPSLEIRKMSGQSYCQGRSKIVLAHHDCSVVTLLHELTHARGFGSIRNPHSRGFVLAYIEMLNWGLGWDVDELRLQAYSFNLI